MHVAVEGVTLLGREAVGERIGEPTVVEVNAVKPVVVGVHRGAAHLGDVDGVDGIAVAERHGHVGVLWEHHERAVGHPSEGEIPDRSHCRVVARGRFG